MIKLLQEVARTTPGIVTFPEPFVLFTGFGASSLDFVVRAWTGDFGESVAIHSNLTVRVHDAIVAARIEIPFPQRDLHLRSSSAVAGAVLAGRQDAASTAPAPPAPPAGTT